MINEISSVIARPELELEDAENVNVAEDRDEVSGDVPVGGVDEDRIDWNEEVQEDRIPWNDEIAEERMPGWHWSNSGSGFD